MCGNSQVHHFHPSEGGQVVTTLSLHHLPSVCTARATSSSSTGGQPSMREEMAPHGMETWSPGVHLQISFCLNDAGRRSGPGLLHRVAKGRVQCLYCPSTKMQLLGQPVQWI